MPDLGKTLELDEAKRLANHVLARAIEDATRHSAGEYDTHLTKRVGVEAYNFLTSMDDECVKDRTFWCSVAGYDADLLVEKVKRLASSRQVQRVSFYRDKTKSDEINRDIFDRTGLVDGMSLDDLLELEDEETDAEEGYTDEYE